MGEVREVGGMTPTSILLAQIFPSGKCPHLILDDMTGEDRDGFRYLGTCDFRNAPCLDCTCRLCPISRVI